jgi:negative elongation factor B
VELCVVKYRDSESLYLGAKELSYCTLRAQLLMTLHDDSCAVAAKDRCHELAWTLDAGIMNGMLTEKHLAKLDKYFEDVDATEK